jgi:hypothetical protein
MKTTMRRKWIYDEELGEMIEVTPGYRPKAKGKDALNHMGGLWSDRHYDGLRATDGADISSRKRHREYMKRHGLTTADDFKGQWDKAQRERDHYMTNGGSIRRQDIAEAISKLQRR